MTRRPYDRSRLAAAIATAAALAALAGVASASATTTASATLTAGSLGFVGTPANVTFGSTAPSAVDRTVIAAEPIDVGDATGSTAGWYVTATSTTFTSGADALPGTATTIAAAPATASCDISSTCAPATAGSVVTYPYSLPAAAIAPSATTMFAAQAGTGMGDQTVTPTWTLTIHAQPAAAVYTSTWTISIVSGP
jgi:hypothetical protein